MGVLISCYFVLIFASVFSATILDFWNQDLLRKVAFFTNNLLISAAICHIIRYPWLYFAVMERALVEITRIFSHTFLTKMSWMQSYYRNVDFTNFFPSRFSTMCTIYKTSLQAILSIWMTKYQGAQVWSSSIALWQISPLKKMASLTTKEEQHWYLLLRLRRGQQEEEGKVDPNQELLCTLLLVLYYMS